MALTPTRTRIALLTNDVLSAYQATLHNAVQRAARAAGCNLITVTGRDLEHVDRGERTQNVVYRWISDQSVDGAILLSNTLTNFSGPGALALLCEQLAPLPTISIGLALANVPSIIIENSAAMRHAVEHVIAHGRRRVAYVGGPLVNTEAVARLAGYKEALQSHGIALDERLVAEGRFTLASGQEAMRTILESGAPFDAVVAANDYMAIGAMDVLREQHIAIPERVLVIGFDNSPIARFAARSLTSVTQPTEQMASVAVREVLNWIEGTRPPDLVAIPADLVLRESCGCGYSFHRPLAVTPTAQQTPLDFLTDSKPALLERLVRNRAEQGSNLWAERLLESLAQELQQDSGVFLDTVRDLADTAHVYVHAPGGEELGRAIMHLQRTFEAAGFHGQRYQNVTQLWLKATSIVAAAVTRDEGRSTLDHHVRSVGLRRATQRMSIAFEPQSLAAELERELPGLGVQRACFMLKRPNTDELEPLIAIEAGRKVALAPEPFPIRQLLPRGFPGGDEWSLFLMALTFENEVFGLVVYGGETDVFVCEALRSQVSATLEMGNLHARVVEQTALQERLSREQMLTEVAVAKRIQTALAPRNLHARGLEIAANMVPADQIGGDYYDVIPTAEGCWLGVGDVTGHGLVSGLIMLMVQSMVSTLVSTRLDASPAELVVALNRVLGPNIRERLGQDDYASLALLRVFGDGRVVYAGCHDDFIVYRARTGRCELVHLSGVWVGVLDDISEQTRDAQLDLEPGDLLVLITDGMVEARNARKEQFGYERLCAVIAAHAQSSPDTIHRQLMAALHSWAPVQQDDATCLVARYQPN